jgi:Predicted amidophosphoribosyltransferases
MSLFADLRDAMGSLADRAIDLSLPVTCAGCYRPGTTLCRACGGALKDRLAAGHGMTGVRAVAPPGPLHQLEWCGPFDGMTRRALERLSTAGERSLSGPLGTAIADHWAITGTGGDAIVPVPAAPDRVRHLGYDHAVLLARVAGRKLGLPVTEALLRLPSYAPSGADKDFEVIAASRIAGRSVVLVDDVVVTGATLASCAEVLLAAGARMVSAVTVARDQWTVPLPMLALAAG